MFSESQKVVNNLLSVREAFNSAVSYIRLHALGRNSQKRKCSPFTTVSYLTAVLFTFFNDVANTRNIFENQSVFISPS